GADGTDAGVRGGPRRSAGGRGSAGSEAVVPSSGGSCADALGWKALGGEVPVVGGPAAASAGVVRRARLPGREWTVTTTASAIATRRRETASAASGSVSRRR